MTSSDSESEFWAPYDPAPDPFALSERPADATVGVSEPILDLPEMPLGDAPGVQQPLLDLPEETAEPSAPVIDLPDAWATDQMGSPEPRLDLPGQGSEARVGDSLPILDLAENTQGAVADRPVPMGLELPADSSDARADQSIPMLLDLPGGRSEANVDRFDPMVIDLPAAGPLGSTDFDRPLDPMLLDLPGASGDTAAVSDPQQEVVVEADPPPPEADGSLDLGPNEPVSVGPEPAVDLSLTPIRESDAPVAATADVAQGLSEVPPAAAGTRIAQAAPVRRSARIGPIIPVAPWWSRAAEGRAPKFVAASAAAVAILVGGVFAIRAGRGGSGADSSRLVSAPPAAAPTTRPTAKIPALASSPPVTPAPPAAVAALAGPGGPLGPPLPGKPAGSAPAAPATSGPASSAGPGADPTATDSGGSDPAVNDGSSAPTDRQPSSRRPPVDLSTFFPPADSLPPPVVTPPPPPPEPPPAPPPTNSPPSHADVCRNVPAAALADCLNAIGG